MRRGQWWLRAVGQLPSLLSLRREETPGCGGFLCKHRTPQPLPLDTLIFFVTCFSFCFSSLLPFFQGHFHFRLSVSSPPHPHPSFVLSSPIPCLPPWDPQWPGLPGPRFLTGVPAGAGAGVRGGKGPVPCLFPTVGKPRSLSDDSETLGSGYVSPRPFA